MKILVTGCCGFVGKSLCARLLDQVEGLEIVGIDNLSRKGAWSNVAQLESLGVKFIHADVRVNSTLQGLDKFDWIIDAAAEPSVLAGVNGKISTYGVIENNLVGTINLLELCKGHGSGFILLSSSRVYSIKQLSDLALETIGSRYKPDMSNMTIVPTGLSENGIGEDFSSEAPISIYGATKISSEIFAQEYGSIFGFPVFINRCGVLAGAGQFGKADQGIFSFWLHSWKRKRGLKYLGFNGSGFQVRDCLHPFDLADLICCQLNTTLAKGSIYNVGGGIQSAMSLRELSEWCESRWGHNDVASDGSFREYDLPWIVLDHSKVTERFDWKPRIKVVDVLEEIADFADLNPDWIDFVS